MKTSMVIDELRTMDPAHAADLDELMLQAEATGVREQIMATPRGRAARRRPQPHRSTRRLVWAGAAIAAALALVFAGSVVLRPDQPGGPVAATAAQVLGQAEAVARSMPDFTLTGDQRIYFASLDRSTGWLVNAATPAWGTTTYAGEMWVAADASLLSRLTPLDASAAETFGIPLGARPTPTGPPPGVADNETRDPGSAYPLTAPILTYDAVRSIPTDPAGFGNYVTSNAVAAVAEYPGGSTNTDLIGQATFGATVAVLTEPLAPPALRAAAFDLLATLPNVVLRGAATDTLGRTGIQLDYRAPDFSGPPGAQPLASSFIIDPTTAKVLQLDQVQSRARLDQSNLPPEAVASVPDAALRPTRTYIGPVVVPSERVTPVGSSLLTAAPVPVTPTP